MIQSLEQAKQAAADSAVKLIQTGMRIGLGTGSTATLFIQVLIERNRKENLNLITVATSERSARQAIEGGLRVVDVDTLPGLDITVDGADEIDQQKRMIKGGGGALLREKIIATMSREMIVVVDESKVVEKLGAFPLPVEVVPFAHLVTLRKMESLGYRGSFRVKDSGELYKTDNGNYIVDIVFSEPCEPEKDQIILRAIPGVVETGFFLGLAGRVIVGHSNGTTTTM